MSTDAQGNMHEEAGRLTDKPHTDPELTLSSIDQEVIRSRRALIDVIDALCEHADALTVLGAHAVIEMTQGIPDAPPDDSTHDADLGVTPSLLLPAPRLIEVMTELGYERASPQRPGVWSPVIQRSLPPYARDSIDLIAPLEVAYEIGARRPRRGARVGDHGEGTVSAAQGTELSVIDRERVMLRAFDGGDGTLAYVAGRSALLCAKAYKLHDRMDPKELSRNPDRLRPKDFADVYRLLLATEPADAAETFERGARADRIGGAVELGRTHLIEILTDDEYVASQVADAWQDSDREPEFAETIATWRQAFTK